MKRLSRLRRHRAAGPILLIFALFTIGTTFQVASAVNNESTSVADRAVTIEEGKQIFLKGCSSCHGLNAEGGQIAPSLIGVKTLSITQSKYMHLQPMLHPLHQDHRFQVKNF